MEEINKTIVVTYDDITRMKDFCTNKGDGVTRDFMDWYVNENSFFSKTGMLITEQIFPNKSAKFVVSFNFNNPDYPEFSLYDYNTQKEICKYSFSREDNLSMKDITIKIKWWDKKSFTSKNNIFVSEEIKDAIKIIEKRTKNALKHKSKRKLNSRKNLLEEGLSEVHLKVCKLMAEQAVYFSYATMYFFAKNKPKEIKGIPKNQLLEDGVAKQISSIYKYTGYININDSKIYKPVIKKDKMEPTREYGRHIEKWSVRGHYRRVNGKIIWIDSFEKGKGELEKRIYGTTKESEVNLIPKVFEVTRTVKYNKPENKVISKNVIASTNEDTPENFKTFRRVFAKIISLFTLNKTKK